MAEEEPAQVSAELDVAADLPGWLRHHAPWLFAPELGVCIVGSQALAIACRAASIAGPRPGDIDLSWLPDHEVGAHLLQQHGVSVPTTVGNRDRGTLALKLDGRRIEITTLRGGTAGSTTEARIHADLGERDMTIGALAIELSTGRCHDPNRGLEHWQQRRIVAVGDVAARVQEHAIRWLRYFRKAHELGFAIDGAIRSLQLDPALLLALPPEAVALELRAVLLQCTSPGRCLCELHEAGLLAVLAPELARQFDGRPAGPQRWHPEVSQALHLILALEWAAAHSRHLHQVERFAVLFAVLCHDLGKGDTLPENWPQHRGHERAGLAHIDGLIARWPGLADQQATTLARHVAELHLTVRHFDELRPGTLARLYDSHFRAKNYPLEPFALALAADSAGRLGHEQDGDGVRQQVLRDLRWLREACATVDAGALREQHGDDLERFRAALHEARARAIASHPRSS